jgi:hypothetical protein
MYLTLVLLYAEQLTNGNEWKVVDAVTGMFLTGPVFLFKANVEIGSQPTLLWSKLFSSVNDYS